MNNLPITENQLYEALKDHFRRAYSCEIQALYHLTIWADGKVEHHRGAGFSIGEDEFNECHPHECTIMTTKSGGDIDPCGEWGEHQEDGTYIMEDGTVTTRDDIVNELVSTKMDEIDMDDILSALRDAFTFGELPDIS